MPINSSIIDKNFVTQHLLTNQKGPGEGKEYLLVLALRCDYRLAFIDMLALGRSLITESDANLMYRSFSNIEAKHAVLIHRRFGAPKFTPDDFELIESAMMMGNIIKIDLDDFVIINEDFKAKSLRKSHYYLKLAHSACLRTKSIGELVKLNKNKDGLIEEKAKIITQKDYELAGNKAQIDYLTDENSLLTNQKKELERQLQRLKDRFKQ
jgi:hypothetical protein